MSDTIKESLHDTIDGLYVVNLESRPDRRRDMNTELKKIGMSNDMPLVTMFKAIRPDTAGAFPSIGARGCFLSQLSILQEAHKKGHRAILILEDDATFTFEGLKHLEAALKDLQKTKWGFAYLGHRIEPHLMPVENYAQSEHWHRLAHETGVVCAHAVLINYRAITILIEYLERMVARPAGHPDGGPMHVDGAYSWFRRDHPEILTLVTSTQYITQRASRSDIAAPSWKENLPLVGLLRHLKNSLVRKN